MTPESKKKLATAIDLQKSKQFTEARIIYEQLELLWPSNAEILHLLGLLDFQQSNYESSIKRIGRAIAINPNIADYHLDKSNALSQIGRFEEALSSCNDAIKLRESFEVAFYNRALVLKKLNKNEEALTSLDSAIKFNSRFPEALNRRGVLLAELNHLDLALESFSAAIDVAPNYFQAHYNKGCLLLKLNRPKQALKCFNSTIEFEPLLAQAYSDRGVALNNLNRLEESLTSYERAIALKPDLTMAHTNMGILLSKTGDLESALNCFLKCIELEPAEMSHQLHLASLYKKLGKLELASSTYEKCVTSTVQKSSDVFHLSVAQLHLGKWKDAFDGLRGWNSPPAHLHDSFESQTAWLGYLKQLPQLHLNTAKNFVPGNTLMFAADMKYVENFFHIALESITENCPNMNTHLHVMLDNDQDVANIERYISNTVSVSYERYSPLDKAGYTTRRFMRLIQLMNHFKRPMLCLDIDSILLGDLSSIWDDFNDTDIGLYLREDEIVIHQLVHASMLFAAPTKGSIAFLGFFTNYIAHLESRGKLKWFADQVALIAAYEWAKRNPGKCSVKKIQTRLMSSSYPHEGALLQTYKGNQKNIFEESE